MFHLQPNDPTSVPEVSEAPKVAKWKVRACMIACGEVSADRIANEAGVTIVGAKKDLNGKGNGPEWYRMVYRNGSWRYVSDERLPRGNYLALERRASVDGVVFTGEIVVRHDRGSPIDAAWLVCDPDAHGKRMLPIDFKKLRSGKIAFTLPLGGPVELTNPRKA